MVVEEDKRVRKGDNENNYNVIKKQRVRLTTFFPTIPFLSFPYSYPRSSPPLLRFSLLFYAPPLRSSLLSPLSSLFFYFPLFSSRFSIIYLTFAPILWADADCLGVGPAMYFLLVRDVLVDISRHRELMQSITRRDR